MNSQQNQFAQKYLKVFGKYQTDQREAVLQQAYDLGRMAVAGKMGVLDMAKVHQEALENVLQPLLKLKGLGRVLKAAETLFLETLSPFEVTHRGFRETNTKLQQLIVTLGKRNHQLAASNQELGVAIRERKRTEKALRESKEHLRELFEEAQRMGQDLRNLSNQILHVQEEERKHISRELHDEVGQSLTAISVVLATLKNNGAGSSSSRKLAEAQKLLQETMETVHRFARELRPAMLDELGLLPALRSNLKSFAGRTGLQVRFQGNPIAEKLGSDQKIVLFRIAQESLTNIGKHAHASQVTLRISKLRDGICMEVADNGRSFKAALKNPGKDKQRLGLLGMQERVRLVNGRFTIHPQPGKGTTVRVIIPFKFPGTHVHSQRRSNRAALGRPLLTHLDSPRLNPKTLTSSRS